MEDNNELLALFNNRSEEALTVLDARYGALCRRIAEAITGNAQDAEECVNDAYRVLWERIPPEQPVPVSAYLLRVVRNLSLNARRQKTAARRYAGEAADIDALDELICDPESETDAGELRDALNGFLGSLERDERILFVKRYWMETPISVLAKQYGISEGALRVRLFRLREKLRGFLAGKGISL